ncbi:MAG: class I SAM-dependent methyltransferase [Acidobacteriota bacterium]
MSLPISQTVVMDEPFQYPGGELALFEKARNWKAYWSTNVGRFISGDVLEVGAGIGANTKLLSKFAQGKWVCLEPDAALSQTIQLPEDPRYSTFRGVLADLPAAEMFNTILYIDVVEHIEDDRAELQRAKDHLHPGGHLIVLSPAWPFLYSPFDKAIGHYRRYTRSSLRAVAPEGMTELEMFFLDSVGMLASTANRWLLKSEMPQESQILTWDRMIVPVSRILDPLLGRNLGRSIIAVWQLPK